MASAREVSSCRRAGSVLRDVVQRGVEVAPQGVKRAAQFLEIDRVGVRSLKAHRREFLLDVPDHGQFAGLVLTQEAGNGINAGNRRQVGELLLERDGLLQVGGDYRAEQDGLGRRVDEVLLKLHRRQTLALHVEQVVVKIDLVELRRRQRAQAPA